jgi:polysaccharide export outer membrane protein
MVIVALLAAVPPAHGRQEAAAGQERPRQVSPGVAAGSAATPKSEGANRGSSAVLLPAAADYVINPSDILEISVDKAEELSATYSVSAAGTIVMPFLGAVVAHGKTALQLASDIADGLRGGYLREPIVRVEVTQPSGQSFFIQGAVRNPGVYQISGRPTLLELITVAGGLEADHGSTAFVIRKIVQKTPATTNAAPAAGAASDDQGLAKYDLVKVNISGLLRGNFENNVPVQPGDIVNVPATDVFFLSGEVHKPGSFPLKDGTTLRQAISLAEGMTFKAARDRVIIFREAPDTGKRTEVRVDAAAIMEGKKEDVLLLANDVVVVPNSRMKSVGHALLSAFGLGMARFPVRYR